MTFVVVILIGAGILLIVSAIENAPIIATFKDIAQGQLPSQQIVVVQ